MDKCVHIPTNMASVKAMSALSIKVCSVCLRRERSTAKHSGFTVASSHSSHINMWSVIQMNPVKSILRLTKRKTALPNSLYQVTILPMCCSAL